MVLLYFVRRPHFKGMENFLNQLIKKPKSSAFQFPEQSARSYSEFLAPFQSSFFWFIVVIIMVWIFIDKGHSSVLLLLDLSRPLIPLIYTTCCFRT